MSANPVANAAVGLKAKTEDTERAWYLTMFSLFRTTLPASSVEHSLSARFLSASEECLVTAGADILKVFRMRPATLLNEGASLFQHPEPTVSARTGLSNECNFATFDFSIVDHWSDSNPPKMRLECVCSWKLHGRVQSMEKVRFLNSSRDALLLSFLDAKISVMEYDPEKHDLKTISLHVFEVINLFPFHGA